MPDAVAHTRIDDDDLRDTLTRALAERTGGTAVVDVERRRSEYSSSYETDAVAVRLADGRRMRVFLKDLGACRYAKDDVERRGLREWAAYRDLLAGAQLGTAEYYGAARDAARGRFWLLLEFVQGRQVKHCDFDQWLAAMSWLGRMHGRFAHMATDLRARSYLLHHDEEFLWAAAERALDAVSASRAPIRRRIRDVTRLYAELIPALLAQPVTLLHGGFRPQNIVAARTHGVARTVPVDWEEAGVGSRWYDVAYFVDGFDAARRKRLLDVYRSGARDDPQPADDDEVSRLVDGFSIRKNLATLGKSREQGFPPTAIEKLAGILTRLATRAASTPGAS